MDGALFAADPAESTHHVHIEAGVPCWDATGPLMKAAFHVASAGSHAKAFFFTPARIMLQGLSLSVSAPHPLAILPSPVRQPLYAGPLLSRHLGF